MPTMALTTRFLLCRTDGIGDLIISQPMGQRILDNDPSSEIFWLVRPEVAPILNNLPGIEGVLHYSPSTDLVQTIKYVKPDILINLFYRNMEIIPAAKRANVPVRVVRSRGFSNIVHATHRVVIKRVGPGRHASEHALEYLKPLGFDIPNAIPPPPHLALTPEEVTLGQTDLQIKPYPPGTRLGVVTRGVAGAFPSYHWWQKTLHALKVAGWNPIILSPPDDSSLPPTNLRGLMARLNACDVVLSVSTGSAHIAAALNVPVLCLMGKRTAHAPDRWRPLGDKVEVIQYPGEEDDLGSGMDRIEVETVLAHLDKLRSTFVLLSS